LQVSQNPTAVSSFFLDSTNGFASKLKNAVNSYSDPTTGELTLEGKAYSDSSTSIEQRISTLQNMLTTRQQSLMQNFIHLETILSGLRTQQTALSSILNLSSSNSSSSNSGSSSSKSS
jgi:flagellar capping protein FliD